MKKYIVAGTVCAGILSGVYFESKIHDSMRIGLQTQNSFMTSYVSSQNDQFFDSIFRWLTKALIGDGWLSMTGAVVGVGEKIVSSGKELVEGKFNYKTAEEMKENVSKEQEKYTSMNKERTCGIQKDSSKSVSSEISAHIETKVLSMEKAKRDGAHKENNSKLTNDFVTKMDKVYCSKHSLELNRCTTLSSMQDANINVSSLFNRHDEMDPATYSPEQKKAAEDFADTLTGGIGVQSLSPAMEKTIVGKEYRVLEIEHQAILNMSKQTLNKSIGSRSPSTDLN